ncbi:hypothetical protein AGMMS49944_31090 [Spirochaetia bacterium]|nr:hypothetical protein AGMMS49944_31090 [Spirochaetia bacterium]
MTKLDDLKLTEAERETFTERCGKYAETMEPEDAELQALADLLKDRERESAARRPHFERINTSDIPPLLWVVKKWIEKGSLNLIFGDSGTGKSFIAIFLAACVSIGVDFFGYKIRRPGAAQRQVYTQLKVQYELLKVTMASEKPVFQILEMAEVPDKKSGPSRGMLCIIVTFAAGFFAVFLAFVLNAISNIRKDPEAMAKLKGEKR